MSGGFHSGKRLKIIREMKGMTQEDLIAEEGFPCNEIRNMGRWETKGIPKKWHQEVAKFFKLELWALSDERLSHEKFKEYLLYPETREQIQSTLLAQENERMQEQLEKDPETETVHSQPENESKHSLALKWWIPLVALIAILFIIAVVVDDTLLNGFRENTTPPHLVTETFDPSTLKFDSTVVNSGNQQVHLIQIGLHISKTDGDFDCRTIAKEIKILADYTIGFSPREEKRIVTPSRQFKFLPGDTGRFTIGVIPNTANACEDWSTQVAAVLIFDDGTRLTTKSYLITEQMVESLERNSL